MYALIIGGSGGIGSAIASQFDANNIRPIIIDKTEPANKTFAFIKCDLTNPDSFAAAMARVNDLSNGEVMYAVNAAGVFGAYDDGVFDRERLEKVMDINVVGTVSLLSLWFEMFGKAHGGVAINISSAAGRRGTSDVAYGMSKAALDSATRSLARAWAPSQVWVFGIAPGLVTTKMAAPMTSERRQLLATNSLIKRESTPEEVANLAVAIALSSPGLVTGSIIDVSGGI